jgi:ferredoxin-thioredoxin reductase catalytic chain
MADVEHVDEGDRAQASEQSLTKMWKFVNKYVEKSGSYLHPEKDITEFLVIGLAKHVDDLGRPLCPCNFYDDKAEEVKQSTWICPCDEMQKWKYCH